MLVTTAKEIFLSPQTFSQRDIILRGWVRTTRKLKSMCFIELNDGSTVRSVQITVDLSVPGLADAAEQNVGAALVVCGRVVLTPEAKQPFEISAASIEIEGESQPDYVLQKKRHSVEFLRTIAHLRPRTNLFNAVFRIRSEAAFAIHSFFHSLGFVLAHTPIITGSDAEGAGEMFRVTTLDPSTPVQLKDGVPDFSGDFFGRETALTVSGQLEAETFALAFGKTYTFGPTFRAEHSNTTRHAAEFWMIEPEIAFADLTDCMELAQAMVKHVIGHVLDVCRFEIEFLTERVDSSLSERLNSVAGSEFAAITYTEAIDLLERADVKFEYPVKWGTDLQTEHERYITETVFQKPVFITDYPADIKAFYMRLNDDQRTVAAMDLLVPGIGELIGGSQREERHDYLLDRIRKLDLDEKDYWWYLDLRKYGGTRHAGFGLGFERLIMYLTGVSNVRDVAAFPRTVGSAEF